MTGNRKGRVQKTPGLLFKSLTHILTHCGLLSEGTEKGTILYDNLTGIRVRKYRNSIDKDSLVYGIYI